MNPYDPPATGTAPDLAPTARSPGWFLPVMSYSACVAFVASGGMALWSAETEPFFGPFNSRDAIISLVGGGLGFLFWLGWSGSILVAVRRRWLPTAVLAFLLLAVLGLLLNWMVVFDYLGDRQNWTADAPF